MPIQFSCSTIVRYDPATQQYERCLTRIQVEDAKGGTQVECPGCRQRIRVPQVSDVRAEAALNSGNSESAVAAAVGHMEGEHGPGRAGRANIAVETGRKTAPLHETANSSLAFSSFAGTRRCKQCGGTLEANRRCTQCGYQATLQASQQPIDPDKIQLAGFQRWLARFVWQGNSTAVMAAIHLLVGLVLFMVVVTGCAGGGLGVVVSLSLAGALALAYLSLIHASRRIARRPAARLSWWQRGGWNGILAICRASGWRFLHGGKPFRVLDLRREQLSEHQLLARADLVDYEVLDAEGIPMSDAGLVRLKGLRRLRRLVIRGSRVSPEGVFRLQQDLPDAWIWS